MSQSAPAPLDVDRLTKLLARLEGESEAEIVTAASIAARMVRDAGLDWPDLVVAEKARGWRGWFTLWQRYRGERRQRIMAERVARHWQVLAEQRERELASHQAPLVLRPEVRKVTGHLLIDRLLATPELDATGRARVEAIASWFSRTRELTVAEQTDLETFARRFGVMA